MPPAVLCASMKSCRGFGLWPRIMFLRRLPLIDAKRKTDEAEQERNVKEKENEGGE